MAVENQQNNMKDQPSGQSFKPNNERISNMVTEGVENIASDET